MTGLTHLFFSDKEFLNEDWHKYTCTETCAAIGNARHGCKSLGTDIQSIRETDDSGCKVLAEIGNMVTNMTGSSILKSTGHTGWVKPVNLSVRFILGDRDPYSDENSDSESEGMLDSDEDQHRRMDISMMWRALIILRMCLISLFPPGH